MAVKKLPSPSTRVVRKLHRPEHVAQMLDVSRATVYTLAKEGKLRSVQIGYRRFFREVDVDDFIASLVAQAVAFGHPHGQKEEAT